MAKSDNEEREQRILDAAASLFTHFGYDKTTVSDIASEAGVSKGAIYLHFDSKEMLFEGLLTREMWVFSEVWLDSLQSDPDGGTLYQSCVKRTCNVSRRECLKNILNPIPRNQ